MRLLTWNIQWNKSSASKAKKIKEIIKSFNPDVVCLTECYDDFFDYGHTACSQESYGYPIKQGRRKVLLWSKEFFSDTDEIGNSEFPSGRFIKATTRIQSHEFDIIGVCVPWRAAHVTTGRKDRQPWEDHITYLKALEEYLLNKVKKPTFLIGDFNQTLEKTVQHHLAYKQFVNTIKHFSPNPNGIQSVGQFRQIDHIFCSKSISIQRIQNIPAIQDGLCLSDHHGLYADFIYAK